MGVMGPGYGTKIFLVPWELARSTRGAQGSEGAHSYIAGVVAATAAVTEALKPAGKRGTL